MPYLKYGESGHIKSLWFHQNEYPKTSFSYFLKYGENKESHVFTIDNTIALKKNVHKFPTLLNQNLDVFSMDNVFSDVLDIDEEYFWGLNPKKLITF